MISIDMADVYLFGGYQLHIIMTSCLSDLYYSTWDISDVAFDDNKTGRGNRRLFCIERTI